MAFPQKKAVILPLSQERRRFQRVRVNLLGRYMLADRREFPCQVTDMSPGGMALIAPFAGQIGERVIAYVDHVGRLEGKVTRHFPERLRNDDRDHAAQTRQARGPADLARQPPHPQSAGRPPPRPCHAAQSRGPPDPAERHQYRGPGDRRLAVRALRLRPTSGPTIGTLVTVGKTAGRVVRHLEDGFAIEFIRLQHPDFRRRERHRRVNAAALRARAGVSARPRFRCASSSPSNLRATGCHRAHGLTPGAQTCGKCRRDCAARG